MHTERMPNNQRQLWHLLALFAELHQGGLAAVRIEQICHPHKHLSVFLADGSIQPNTGRPSARHGNAVIVLLLSRRRSSRSSLRLSMLLRS